MKKDQAKRHAKSKAAKKARAAKRAETRRTPAERWQERAERRAAQARQVELDRQARADAAVLARALDDERRREALDRMRSETYLQNESILQALDVALDDRTTVIDMGGPRTRAEFDAYVERVASQPMTVANMQDAVAMEVMMFGEVSVIVLDGTRGPQLRMVPPGLPEHLLRLQERVAEWENITRVPLEGPGPVDRRSARAALERERRSKRTSFVGGRLALMMLLVGAGAL